MGHSNTKIWIHTVFGTKDKLPLISEQLEKVLHSKIISDMQTGMKCPVEMINGTMNHLHILFLQNQNYSLKDILKNIKGETSHWINQNNLTEAKFSWQISYAAFSVSQSNAKSVARYISNQKEFHKKVSFTDEYNMLIKKHGINV
ncbi:MAG: transposase [Ignavibacteria bacterium]